MNIAWYSHYFIPEIGAPSARIHDLSRVWLNLGHQVQTVTCLPNHPKGELYPGYNRCLYMHEKINGIAVHRHLTYITPNRGFLRKIIGHISFLPAALFVSSRRLIRPDIVIGTSPTFFAAMAACIYGLKRRIPFIMEVRDLWPAIFVELGVLKNPLLIRLLELIEIGLYKCAKRIVAVTESFRNYIVAKGINPSKVVTIPNGADTEFWQPTPSSTDLRRRLGLENKFVVLYIGAHGISHALGSILESAERLAKFRRIQFVFVGDGAEKEMLMQKAGRMRLTNVLFRDPVGKHNVRDYYGLADVCLVPLKNIPLFDTFIPSKMFEIMAMGRAIVGSIQGEAADILKQSDGGILVEPENSEALAAAVLDLFNQPLKIQNLGENGRTFVCANYARHALAKKYAQALADSVRDFKASSS